MAEGQSMTVADVVAQVRDGRLEDFVRVLSAVEFGHAGAAVHGDGRGERKNERSGWLWGVGMGALSATCRVVAPAAGLSRSLRSLSLAALGAVYLNL